MSDLKEKQSKHSQGYCISILVLLFLSFVIEVYYIYRGQYNMADASIIVVMIIVTILTVLDRADLKSHYPDRKIFNGFSILIFPVYFFLRSRFVGEKQYFLGSWIVLMIVGTGVTYLVDEAYAKLPSCADQYVMWNLKNIVESNGYEFIDMKNIKEISVNTEQYIRVCQGSVSIAETGTEIVQYKISWIEALDDWDIEYIVEE